jgi:hypothetical protein
MAPSRKSRPRVRYQTRRVRRNKRRALVKRVRDKEEKENDDDDDDVEEDNNIEEEDNEEAEYTIEEQKQNVGESKEEENVAMDMVTEEEEEKEDEEWLAKYRGSKEFRMSEYKVVSGPEQPIQMGIDYDYEAHIARHLENNNFPRCDNGVVNLMVWNPVLQPKVKEMAERRKIKFRNDLVWKNLRVHRILSRPFLHDSFLVCFAHLSNDHHNVVMIEFDPFMTLNTQYGEDLMCFVQAGLNSGLMTREDYEALCAKCDIYECADVR